MGDSFEDRFVQVGGVRARYWRAGDGGSAVLLLGGIGCSVIDWTANIDALAAGRTVYALDMLGEGLTDKPDGDRYGLPDLARFVFAFLGAVGVERAHIVGHSLGGRITLECARQDPGRVLSMTLVAPAGVGRATHIMMRLPTVPYLGELLSRPSPSGLKTLWRLGVHDPALITDAFVATKYRLASAPGAHSAFLKTLRGFVGIGGFERSQMEALQKAMPAMTAPALVIWGREDRLLPCAQAEILRSRLPRAEVRIFETCGHVPQMEQPEAFNETAAAFLDRAM